MATENINFMLFAAITKSVALLSRSSIIYNCSSTVVLREKLRGKELNEIGALQ